MSSEKERRFCSPGHVDVRRANAKKERVEGYAAIFESKTNLGAFDEQIAKGAFDDALNDDIRALFNHDPNFPLARSVNGEGTLKVWVDDIGLKYSFKPGDQSYAKDLVEAIERGDVTQSSFGFSIKDQSWEHRDGRDIRTIVKVDRLFDVSPVSFPAYTDTAVALRSKPEMEIKKDDEKQTETKDGDVSKVAVARQRLNLHKTKK